MSNFFNIVWFILEQLSLLKVVAIILSLCVIIKSEVPQLPFLIPIVTLVTPHLRLSPSLFESKFR